MLQTSRFGPFPCELCCYGQSFLCSYYGNCCHSCYWEFFFQLISSTLFLLKRRCGFSIHAIWYQISLRLDSNYLKHLLQVRFWTFVISINLRLTRTYCHNHLTNRCSRREKKLQIILRIQYHHRKKFQLKDICSCSKSLMKDFCVLGVDSFFRVSYF